jgi:hypothetical protein
LRDNHDLPSHLHDLAGQLQSAVQRLDPRSLSDAEAVAALKVVAEAERVCAAGRTILARRLERSKAWHGQGYKTAAHWIAAHTGVSVGQAVGTLETGRRLEHLPATEMAFVSGELAETRVKEVAIAAEASPASEGELLEAARTDTVRELKDRCRNVVASATDEGERYQRTWRHRYVRCWTETTGAFRLAMSTTPDAGADLLAALEPYHRRIAEQARKAGRTETSEAYAADALVAMARDRAGTSSGPRTATVINVDHPALMRGFCHPGETCEIPGIGPIPVTVARALAADSFLKVLVRRGTDIKAVGHAGRTIPAALRTAVEARYPTCAVRGCDVRHQLEIDHVLGQAQGGLTTHENLIRLCTWHHMLKSTHEYRLVGSHGNWTLVGPDPP